MLKKNNEDQLGTTLHKNFPRNVKKKEKKKKIKEFDCMTCDMV